ncbi:MAG: LAGLIDADG family homing endonuclease [Candidatus Aenigmatarchaeota archaeon]
MDNGIVDFWSLPHDKIYLNLENELKEKIFNSSKEYAGSWSKLGKCLGLSLNKYGSCKIIESARCKKFSLFLLDKIIDYLNSNGEKIDKKNIEKKITVLSSKRGGSNKLANSIFNPKIPFNFNTVDGATVLSSIFYDGGINSNLLPHYSNPDNVELRKSVFDSFTNVFGTFKSKKSNPLENPQLYFPKIVGVILVYGLGLSYGRKVVNNPSIPEFLFESSEEIKSSFLRQAFDDEGSVHKTKRNISFKLASSSERPAKLLTGVKCLLESLNIESNGPHYVDTYNTKNGITASRWRISVTHQDNLKKFYEKIGFHSSYKKNRLKNIIHTLKYPHYSVKNRNKIIIKSCSELQKRYGFITSRELAIQIDRSRVLAKKVIRKLVDRKVLLVKECRHGNMGAKYVLSDNYESLCKM